MAVTVSGPMALRRVQATRRRRPERGALQSAVTVRATAAPGSASHLADALHRMGTDPRRFPGIPFGELAGVHFARLVLLGEEVDLRGRIIGASVIYAADVDGDAGAHLAELAELAGEALDAVLRHCRGYPGEPTPASRLAFLSEHRIPAQARYVNTIGRTVEQALREAELRDSIAGFLDAHHGEWRAMDASRVRRAVQDFVRSEPDLRWARRRAPRPSLRRRAGEKLHAIGVGLGLLAISPLVALALPPWAFLLRLHEKTDPAPHLRPDPEHLARLAELEDFAAQNQFSVVGFVKPGPFRRVTVRMLLWLTDFATRHVFNHANLAGVKTIHFARWVVIDEGRRVVFFSNYDGSVESYMDDFIDKVAWGLNALFSNGVGYPRTRWLIGGGARQEQAFKDVLRRRQIPTQVFYSAYDQLSARNLRNNSLIRSGLFGPMSRREAEAWVARL